MSRAACKLAIVRLPPLHTFSGEQYVDQATPQCGLRREQRIPKQNQIVALQVDYAIGLMLTCAKTVPTLPFPRHQLHVQECIKLEQLSGPPRKGRTEVGRIAVAHLGMTRLAVAYRVVTQVLDQCRMYDADVGQCSPGLLWAFAQPQSNVALHPSEEIQAQWASPKMRTYNTQRRPSHANRVFMEHDYHASSTAVQWWPKGSNNNHSEADHGCQDPCLLWKLRATRDD
jgi:hypothetical protein